MAEIFGHVLFYVKETLIYRENKQKNFHKIIKNIQNLKEIKK